MANIPDADRTADSPPAIGMADVAALEAAVSSMGNWKAVLLAQREPTDKYEEALQQARASVRRLRAFVEAQHG